MIATEQKQRSSARPLEPGTDLVVIRPGETFASVTDNITSIALHRKTLLFWWIMFCLGLSSLVLFIVSVTWLFYRGVGIFGIQIPVAWGYAITDFVWWIGIGHAGTLISAILL